MNIDFEFELNNGEKVFVVADVDIINNCDCNYCSGYHPDSVSNVSIVDANDSSINEASLTFDEREGIEYRALGLAEEYYNER